MSKISDLNYSQHITLADNFKQKSEVLNTWRVGMNDFARIAGGQDSRRNILSPRAFLEFLAKIFTLGYVDFSKRSNEAGRNMMAHIESSSYIKNNDGSEIMNFVMNNPEGERADSSKVIIEISLSTTTTMGTRQGHTAIIFPQSDFLSFRYVRFYATDLIIQPFLFLLCLLKYCRRQACLIRSQYYIPFNTFFQSLYFIYLQKSRTDCSVQLFL